VTANPFVDPLKEGSTKGGDDVIVCVNAVIMMVQYAFIDHKVKHPAHRTGLPGK
jgi:hypothetical protein